MNTLNPNRNFYSPRPRNRCFGYNSSPMSPRTPVRPMSSFGPVSPMSPFGPFSPLCRMSPMSPLSTVACFRSYEDSEIVFTGPGYSVRGNYTRRTRLSHGVLKNEYCLNGFMFDIYSAYLENETGFGFNVDFRTRRFTKGSFTVNTNSEERKINIVADYLGFEKELNMFVPDMEDANLIKITQLGKGKISIEIPL